MRIAESLDVHRVSVSLRTIPVMLRAESLAMIRDTWSLAASYLLTLSLVPPPLPVLNRSVIRRGA